MNQPGVELKGDISTLLYSIFFLLGGEKIENLLSVL